MIKLTWTFILLVTAFDIAFTWRFRGSVSQWESNPIALWVACWAGIGGVIGYRVLWLAFAAGLAFTHNRLSRLLTPVWAIAHLYLLLVLAESYSYVASIDQWPGASAATTICRRVTRPAWESGTFRATTRWTDEPRCEGAVTALAGGGSGQAVASGRPESTSPRRRLGLPPSELALAAYDRKATRSCQAASRAV